MFKRWITGLFAVGLVLASAVAQAAFVEGEDYQLIDPAVKTVLLGLDATITGIEED